MEETTPARPAAVLVPLALALIAAGVTAWLVLAGEPRWGALAAASAGLGLVAADLRIRRGAPPRLTFAGSLSERAVDAVILGALAWDLMPLQPRAGAAAAAALSAAFVATYIGAKASGLGFRVREPAFLQPARTVAVALGLGAGAVEAGLWAAAAVSVAGAVGASLQIAAQEEPA